MTALGRLVPPDWQHVVKHPFTAATNTGVAVIGGFNWYEGYDNPTKGRDGRFRVRISGGIRGGHCTAFEPADVGEQDAWAFHVFYDQGQEGACTGFGTSRAISLKTRRRYDGFWVYDDARRIEHTYPEGEGAYVRDALKAAVQWGAHFENSVNCVRTPWNNHTPGTQIKSYHWCTSAEQVRIALGYPPTIGEIPLLNSWGTSYPETVYVSLGDVQRLLNEEGEMGVPVF